MFTRMVANYETILDRGDLVYANFYIMLVHAMMNVVGFLVHMISYVYRMPYFLGIIWARKKEHRFWRFFTHSSLERILP